MIQWKESEFKQVAKEWIRICRNENVDPLRPPGLGAKARNAQTVLPRDRQRPPHSLQGTQQLKPLLRAVEDQLKLEKTNSRLLAAQFDPLPVNKSDVVPPKAVETSAPTAEVIPLVAPTKAVEPAETLEATQAEFKLRTVVEETPVGTPSALALMLEQQVVAFAQGLAKMFVEETMKEMHKAFAVEFPKLQSKAATVTKNLPKVLVVGPMVKQQEGLEACVAGMLDLKFVSSEEGAKLINTRGSNCVCAVLWTGKISHSHQENAVRTIGRESIRYVTGGIESIKTALEDIALQVAA